jgi:hypothetical protein
MKNKWLLTMVAGSCLASLTSASAVTTTQGFGSIPGVTQAQNPYSGSGIPINASEYVVASGVGGGNDTVTIALAATAHGSSNPAPGNNGAGTYSVNTGLVGGRSVWNFDFYGNSSLGLLGSYVFSLTETANGHTFSFNPAAIPDNVGGPNSFGNSESLDFATFGLPLSYDPNANDTYNFLLTVKNVDGALIASDSITVNAGTGRSVPDAASTATLLGFGLVGILALGYKRNRFAVAK